MKPGRDLYREICEAENLDAAVSRLSRDELAEVAEYLADLTPAGGIPSQVWGLVCARLAPPKRKAESRKQKTEKC